MLTATAELSEKLAYDWPAPPADQDAPGLVALLQETARFLWKEWPAEMELSWLGDDSFVLRGRCPHCGDTATFTTVTNLYVAQKNYDNPTRLIAPARCVGCRECILAIVRRERDLGRNFGDWEYEAHYPLGKPDDSLPDGIPEGIGSDFQQALRCQFVDAYSATAEMCRRAIEASCLDLGAPYDEVLETMIDWLEDKRHITPVHKNVAHKIRLGGNRGAHPWKVGQPVAKPIPVIVIEKEHAEAIVNFTWHFLEHVYIIPKQLPEFDFSKPKKEKA